MCSTYQASLLYVEYYHFSHEYWDATTHGLASVPVRHAYCMYAGALGRNLNTEKNIAGSVIWMSVGFINDHDGAHEWKCFAILMMFSSLAALKVAISYAASDENFIKKTAILWWLCTMDIISNREMISYNLI